MSEAITGQDFVAWQLCVAAGGALPRSQQQLQVRGHAFEARIYAESPRNNFLPGGWRACRRVVSRVVHERDGGSGCPRPTK